MSFTGIAVGFLTIIRCRASKIEKVEEFIADICLRFIVRYFQTDQSRPGGFTELEGARQGQQEKKWMASYVPA